MPSLPRISTTQSSSSIPSVPWEPPPPSDPHPDSETDLPPPAWHPTLEEFDIYYLQQTTRDTQTLTPAERLSSLPSYNASTSPSGDDAFHPLILPAYTIKSKTSAGFMNRKPDMLMLRSSDTGASPTCTAEVRFDRVSSRTLISYPSSQTSQEMDVESSRTQKLLVTIDGEHCTWQPADGQSKRCVELRSTEEGLMACFTYANEPNRFGYAKEDASGDVGVLQVSELLRGGEGALEQVLCSAAVLVERNKRRAQSLGMDGNKRPAIPANVRMSSIG